MYVPPAFRLEDLAEIRAALASFPLASFVTAGSEGLMATPLPLFLDESEGPHGTLYGHLARANPQQKTDAREGMAIFMGPDAYVTPSWYETKRETGKVVPTWNYVAIHAWGEIAFFDDPARLHDVVSRLTRKREAGRAEPWEVADAPERFVAAQLRGIVGLRMTLTRMVAKSKMSQNRNAADRSGVSRGLAESGSETDRTVANLIPE